MGVDAQRLERLFGPDTRWIVDRLRERLERGAPLDGAVVRQDATESERAAAQRLLGRRPRPGRSLRVPLADLEKTLLSSGCAGTLAEAVEALTGPVVDRRAVAADLDRRWSAAVGVADPLVRIRPELAGWRERMATSGLLRRLSDGPEEATALMEQAVTVLSALPGDGVPLSVFAARTCNDGHALDADRPLSTLVLRAAAALGGVSEGLEGGDEGTAAWRREVWAAVGVLVSDLVSPVLTLGLPGDDSGPTGRALAVWRAAGQPVHLSLRQLVRDPPELDMGGCVVSVCENPSVVAGAADILGPACAPLVCVSGMPGGAATTLLRMLVDRGADLRYHGDFDWGGIAIANTVVGRFGAQRWRFDAAHYEAAIRPDSPPLRGRPVAATFDPTLSDALSRRLVRVEEETVLDDLLADLSSRTG